MKFYCSALHRGGLKETMETEFSINIAIAKCLIDNGFYHLVGFDDRIKAKRYLLNDIPGNLGMPQWIHEYDEEVLNERLVIE